MIRRLLPLLAVLAATPLAAADYCTTVADAVPQLPAALAGDWQITFRDGFLIDEQGKPQPLPGEDGPEDARFTAEGDSLTLAEDLFFPAVTMAPAEGAVDFALPGESPLDAAELLSPETQALGLICPPGGLPQYRAELTLDEGAIGRFYLFALTPDDMVMVIRGDGAGQVVRAVFDLQRKPRT